MTEHTDGDGTIEQFTSSTGQVERFEFDDARPPRAPHRRAGRDDRRGHTLRVPRRLAVPAAPRGRRRARPCRRPGLGARHALAHRRQRRRRRRVRGRAPTARSTGYATASATSPATSLALRRDRHPVPPRTAARWATSATTPAGCSRWSTRPATAARCATPPAGRMLSAARPDGAVTSIEYDRAGLPRTRRRAGRHGDRVRVRRRAAHRGRASSPTATRIGFDRDELGRETSRRRRRQPVDDRSRPGRPHRQASPTRAGVDAEAERRPLGRWMSITDATGAALAARARADQPRPHATHAVGRHEATVHRRRHARVHLVVGRRGAGHPLHRGRAHRVDHRGRPVDRVPLRRGRADDRRQQRHRLVAVRPRRQRSHRAPDVARRVASSATATTSAASLPSITVGGESWSFDHDTAGPAPRAHRSRPGAPRPSTYDQRGRMVASSDPGGVALRYAYDGRGAASPSCSTRPAGRCRTSTTRSTS